MLKIRTCDDLYDFNRTACDFIYLTCDISLIYVIVSLSREHKELAMFAV